MKQEIVQITVGDLESKVEKPIALLVEEMWKAGIVIDEFSYGDFNDGYECAFLSFIEPQLAKKFLDIVADNREYKDMTSLYRRINPPFDYDEKIPKWIFHADANDRNIGDPTKSDFCFNIHILIPHQDIPLVVERLKEYNKF